MKVSQPLLDEIVTRLDQEGVTVKMHAIGDGAVRFVIDAIAKVRRNNGVVGPTHSIAHASFIAPVDLKRMADMNLSVDISPYSLFRAPMIEEIAISVGMSKRTIYTLHDEKSALFKTHKRDSLGGANVIHVRRQQERGFERVLVE
jgi:predicted amidohydrolase YtcJ